jgi:hypothetical protein
MHICINSHTGLKEKQVVGKKRANCLKIVYNGVIIFTICGFSLVSLSTGRRQNGRFPKPSEFFKIKEFGRPTQLEAAG